MARCNPVAVGEHEAEDLENWLVQNGSTHQTVFERIFTKYNREYSEEEVGGKLINFNDKTTFESQLQICFGHQGSDDSSSSDDEQPRRKLMNSTTKYNGEYSQEEFGGKLMHYHEEATNAQLQEMFFGPQGSDDSSSSSDEGEAGEQPRRKPLTSRCPSEEEAGIVKSEQWVRRRKPPTLTSRCPSEEEAGIVKSEQWVRRRKAPTLTSRFPSHAQEEAGIEQWVWRRKPPILTCGFPSEEEAGMLSGFVDSSSETNTDMASEDELMSGFVTSEWESGWESAYEQWSKKCRTDRSKIPGKGPGHHAHRHYTMWKPNIPH